MAKKIAITVGAIFLLIVIIWVVIDSLNVQHYQRSFSVAKHVPHYYEMDGDVYIVDKDECDRDWPFSKKSSVPDDIEPSVWVSSAYLYSRFPSFTVPPPSSTWDCDDDALYMYNQLKEAGWKTVIPVIGNLELSGESYLDLEYDHVWIMVRDVLPYEYSVSDPKQSIPASGVCYIWVAYDWGEPCFDLQHYEGAIITPNELLKAVEYDKQ